MQECQPPSQSAFHFGIPPDMTSNLNKSYSTEGRPNLNGLGHTGLKQPTGPRTGTRKRLHLPGPTGFLRGTYRHNWLNHHFQSLPEAMNVSTSDTESSETVITRPFQRVRTKSPQPPDAILSACPKKDEKAAEIKPSVTT